MNAFIDSFSQNIKASYTGFDRVILRGYLHSLWTEGGVVSLLRRLRFRQISNGVMRILTDQLNAHVQKKARELGVPIVWWANEGGGTDGAKRAYVEAKGAPRDVRKPNQVLCILAAMESARSFVTRELTTKGGQPYEKMYPCRKQVKHYYIYVHDAVLGGPCYLKMCTYLPFPVEFYFNGHHAIAQELGRRGVGFRKEGNAFLDLDDSQAVQAIAESLTGSQVQARIDYWTGLFFRFDKGCYSTVPDGLRHQWYCSQVEVCTNTVFKSAAFCTRLFERLLDKFSRIGSPDSVSQVFGQRRVPKTTHSHRRRYDNNACLKSWCGRNSVKWYNKHGNFLRVETTINGPKSLGLKKPVVHLREYLTTGAGCNRRLMECLSDVDARSLGGDETAAIDQPVVTDKGKRHPALDLRKARQAALAKALLKPQYSAFGFRTRDLLKTLGEVFETPGQIRYELVKYRARGWVEKLKGKSFWRVTPLGYAVTWSKTAAKSFFEDPMISLRYAKPNRKSVSHPSNLEQGYDRVNEGLLLITKELFVKRAA